VTNITEGAKEHSYNTPIKIIISILYFLLSVLIIFLIYKKTHLSLKEIYEILNNYKWIFFLSLLSYSMAFLLKVLRWWIIVNFFYNKLFNLKENHSFSYMLYLSSLSLILNSLGMSLIISDGIKSSILALNNYKKEKTIHKIWIFLSPYLDRIIGLSSAIILAIPFFFPSSLWIITSLLLILSFSIFFIPKTVNIITDKYKIIYGLFILSMFSHIFDSLSLFLFVKGAFNLELNFFQWFIAFILGGLGSILSVFGGLGGRTYGISIILNNIKTSLILDIVYYLLQIITSIFFFLTSFIFNKYFKK